MSRWRARASLVEGLTNVRDGATLSAVLVAVATLVVGGAVLLDLVSAGAVLATERDYLDAGGDLLVAQAASDGTLDAARCDALTHVTGVRAAAAVTVSTDAARLVGRPASAQTVVTATAGIIPLLDLPTMPADGVVASRVVAERWQWTAGTHLQLEPRVPGLPTSVLEVRAVTDLAQLSEAASTGVLLVATPTRQADACFVRVHPQYRDTLRDTIPAALGATQSAPVNVADRVPAGALSQDPRTAWEDRPTRWAPLAAGLVVGLLWSVIAWTRRGRAALYASVGVPYAGGVLLRWTEGAAVVVLGTAWGCALAAGVAAVAVDIPLRVAVSLVLRGGGSALVVALALVALVGLWRPPTLAALKDR